MRHALEMFRKPTLVIRKPTAEDGAAIWELVQSCKPLDENSMYCNLIQCDHFRDTCIVAEAGGRIVGWVSAYVLPYDPETLFVWQVAVAEEARGTGLGKRMLQELIEREACADVRRVQTTITSDNAPSWALFRRFADYKGRGFAAQAHFTRNTHFRGLHATEHMVTITLSERVRKAA